MNSNDVNTEKLINDLKVVVRDAEELLRVTAGEVSEKAKSAREKLITALDSAKGSCQNLEQKAVEGAKVTDQLVRAHPYQSMGIAFGVGLLLGVILNRR